MAGLSGAMIGQFADKCKVWERIVLTIGGLCLIDPKLMTDVAGIALLAIVGIIQYMRKKKSCINKRQRQT